MLLAFRQNSILNKNRYRLYREHKYIFYVFSELLQLASTLDFSNGQSLGKLQIELKKLDGLLQSHAEYEESRIHLLLKNKNSTLLNEAEHHHRDQKLFLEKMMNQVNMADGMKESEAHFFGYELYLDLRNFFSHNLNHFDYEERVIMPEVQRLSSDDEIREIDRLSYRQMSPEQMVDMMQVLFPHMNCDDRYTFLSEIKECEPQKFEIAWDSICLSIEENERNKLNQHKCE